MTVNGTIFVAGCELWFPRNMEEAIKVSQEIAHLLGHEGEADVERDGCGCVRYTWPSGQVYRGVKCANHSRDRSNRYR